MVKHGIVQVLPDVNRLEFLHLDLVFSNQLIEGAAVFLSRICCSGNIAVESKQKTLDITFLKLFYYPRLSFLERFLICRGFKLF